MRRMLMSIAAGAALTCLGLPAATAQDPGRTVVQDRDRDDLTSLTDAQFLQRAALSGMMEVSLSKLVDDHTNNEALEQYAERMIKDHDQANEQIVKLAESKDVDVPNALDERHKQMYDRFADMEEGTAFERAYLQNQLRAHQRTVNLFAAEAERGRDPEIQAFARKTLPTLRQHLQMAERLSGAATGTTTTTAPPRDRDR